MPCTYSLTFVFSMTGPAVPGSFGIACFGLGVRFLLMWLMSIPTIDTMSQAVGGDADHLPGIWVIRAFPRVRLAVRRRQNEIVLARVAV